MAVVASRTLGEVQISASQGCTGEVRAWAMPSRIVGGARVWISPIRLKPRSPVVMRRSQARLASRGCPLSTAPASRAGRVVSVETRVIRIACVGSSSRASRRCASLAGSELMMSMWS